MPDDTATPLTPAPETLTQAVLSAATKNATASCVEIREAAGPTAAQPPRPTVGRMVHYTPLERMSVLDAAKQLEGDPRMVYPRPVALAAIVIGVEPTGEVDLYVMCPSYGPYGVHMAGGPAARAGTDEARGRWAWPERS